MDEGETKTCENCKREIPGVNYTTHALHCTRNLRVCPACKEPVPLAELAEHHDRLHKLVPCAQCGDGVCGTDLEDHVRDSCAHTMKTCRFCALELRRGALPAHERYCGARTERCEQCGEWVMHKYRQLHLDSNHGFIRLHEDPVPNETAVKTPIVPKPSSSKPDLKRPTNPNRPLAVNRYFPPADLLIPNTSKPQNVCHSIDTSNSPKPTVANGEVPNVADTVRQANGTIASVPGINRQTHASVSNLANINTQINGLITNSTTHERNTNPGSNIVPSTSNLNGVSSHKQNGAVPRVKRSNLQPQVNTAGAAPDKVHKDLWAARGAVKKRPAPAPPAPAAPAAPPDRSLHSALLRRRDEEAQRREQTARNAAQGLPPVLSAAAKLDRLRRLDALHAARDQPDQPDQPDLSGVLQGRVWRAAPAALAAGDALGAAPDHADLQEVRRRQQLRNLKPMSPEQFLERFSELQMRGEPPAPAPAPDDRFSQIKSSLRELRRGLNEVTAPYSSSGGDSNHNGEVRLPCEFCAELVLPDDLVQHQTGCRPDLTQYRPEPRSRPGSRAGSRPESPLPVIPCEFCAASLPVYLISEHQERCGREANLLFPD